MPDGRKPLLERTSGVRRFRSARNAPIRVPSNPGSLRYRSFAGATAVDVGRGPRVPRPCGSSCAGRREGVRERCAAFARPRRSAPGQPGRGGGGHRAAAVKSSWDTPRPTAEQRRGDRVRGRATISPTRTWDAALGLRSQGSPRRDVTAIELALPSPSCSVSPRHQVTAGPPVPGGYGLKYHVRQFPVVPRPRTTASGGRGRRRTPAGSRSGPPARSVGR